jgi:hypothetical protein
MRIKSKFSPIVVIGFLLFSMSMAASFNVHAAKVTSQCKQAMAVNRMLNELEATINDLMKEDPWGSVAKLALDMRTDLHEIGQFKLQRIVYEACRD